MKTLFLAVMFAWCGMASAGPNIFYDGAISSITVLTVSLSSSAATLISKAPVTSQTEGIPHIAWGELSLYNVAASSAVYAFSGSATVAPSPALACTATGGAPIGTGTAAVPTKITEKFMGFYMWGLSCADGAALSLKVVYRGW
jgi:hypothetical protein